MPSSTSEDVLARSKPRGTRPTLLGMLETTPARVASPHVPATVEEPLSEEEIGWRPLDLPRAVRSRRTFRFSFVVIALLAAGGLFLAWRFALALPLAQAESRRTSYRAPLEAAAAALPDLEVASAAITGNPPADALSPHLAALARLEGISADLRTAAARPLPPSLPGVPDADLSSLDPLRDRMAAIADRITSIGSLLTDVSAYRRSLDGMFLLPDLPGPGEGPSVEVFSDRLAQMTAATVEAAAALPHLEVFAAHRAAVDDLLAWLPEWQAVYLEALREDDLDAAARMREEAVSRIASVRDGLADPLEAAAAWVRAELSRLRLDVEGALLLAG